LKPYHGLRIFINEQDGQFTQQAFVPIYGCTRVVAHDFDQDGDVDFATTAYFADWENEPNAGFVYLENTDASNFQFSLHTAPAAKDGRWLVMEKGDFDADGDMDLALGSFLLPPGRQYQEIATYWRSSGTELLLLHNTLR
ncbi:MAG: VCBS repeat-containing protein, partial [Bacteroidota bacterium]